MTVNHERWSALLRAISYNSKTLYTVLEAGATEAELQIAEQEQSAPLPEPVRTVLAQWSERGSELLLTTVPSLLNVGVPPSILEPTGLSIRELFPEFCYVLDQTEHFAVVIEPSAPPEFQVLFAGLCNSSIPTGEAGDVVAWAYYLPGTLADIEQHERQEGIRLSPQFKQMLLRANGTPLGNIYGYYPEFGPLQGMRKGELAASYKEFWSRLNSPDPFEKLEEFVPCYNDLAGNSQGFFANEVLSSDEYTIYDWDHETTKFTVWARDFAAWTKLMFEQTTE